LSVELVIEDRDLWTESGLHLDSASGSTYREELLEEWHWRGFLGSRRPWWIARQGLRILRTYLGASSQQGPSASIRLLNIEFAHRSLWEQGLASGAEMIVVLEDDAELTDASDVAQAVAALADSPWAFINLSLSFTPDQLGVADLLLPSGVNWGGLNDRVVLRSTRPITNTVCALVYRRDFLSSLLSSWAALPVEPVLPIDWKMNKVLRSMVESGQLEESSALWVEPGPFIQRSLHPAPQP